jgi:hypothetical protein
MINHIWGLRRGFQNPSFPKKWNSKENSFAFSLNHGLQAQNGTLLQVLPACGFPAFGRKALG